MKAVCYKNATFCDMSDYGKCLHPQAINCERIRKDEPPIMQKNYIIACIIVTYNRKSLLNRCLDAVDNQSYRPSDVYIVDNASTDGTLDSVKESGYYNSLKNEINYHYILNKRNEGGAGGFYIGMKTAFDEKKYDAFWVMDDDGEPAPSCLKELLNFLGIYHYIAPMVLSDEDRIHLSFYPTRMLYSEFIKRAENGIIKEWGNPFNGILYSYELVSKVGFPKKEMFIWGDEVNYELRCNASGYGKISVVTAIHYHPFERLSYVLYNGLSIPVINEDWKFYCHIRNKVYNRVRFEAPMAGNPLRRLRKQFSIFKQCIREINVSIEYYRTMLEKDRRIIAYSAALSGGIGYFGGLANYLKRQK